MNRPRPLAGALLAILVLMPAGHAAEVDKIGTVTGGEVSLTPPDAETAPSVDPIATGPADIPTESSSSGDSPMDWPFNKGPGLQTMHFGAASALSCTVAETPGAIVVVNHGSEALPAGTRIRWQVPGQRGYFALRGPLDAGQRLIADKVLDSAADFSAACTARVI